MPLEDFAGMTVVGVSTEAWLRERAAEDQQKADVWKRLQQLEQLQKDLEALREKHQALAFELRDFGRTLGLAQLEATDDLMKEPDDAA